MNNFLKYILPCALAGAFFTGCNDLSPDDRFIELPPVEGDRVVLLEDYTGQKCPNCPDGARIVEQLHEQYGNRFISVSIHAGDFAVPVNYNRYLGLMQPFGNDMARAREVDTYPSGVIDGGAKCDRSEWAAKVRDAMSVPSTCDITFSNLQYLPEIEMVSGVVKLLPGVTCDGAVGIWLIEDNVIARQYNVNGDHEWVMDYSHNHVLRAYWGENYFGNTVSLTRESGTDISFSFPVDETWKPENLSVVIFVKNMETGAYMQSAIRHISE